MKGTHVMRSMWLCLVLTVGTTANAEERNPSGAPEGWPEPILDSEPHAFWLFDQLEYQNIEGTGAVAWDALGWYGGDYQRLWIETEGEDLGNGGGGEIERFDVQYGRLIAPFWDVQVGLGYQRAYGDGPDQDRVSAIFGLQGLAPQWFEVDANLRVSEDGDVSADLEAEYDLLLTQRWVLQPRFETGFAFQDVDEFDVASGLNSVRLSLRLRYEIRREFAPYIGVSWSRLLGDTADIARAGGEDVEETAVVAGVRFWF